MTQALTSRDLTSLLDDDKQGETFQLLDKLAGNALRLSLRDSNVSSLSIDETKFSTMYSSLCTLFSNTEIRNKKATMVKELTNQIKYIDKEGGIVKYLNRKATGFYNASRLGSAQSITE